MDITAKQIWGNLELIREKRPLIHNITNFVVMNETANVILCVGASPVMAHAPEEVAEMASFAGALVLNIGTLYNELIEAMIIAGKKANEVGTPVALDPVGAGATRMRTEAVKRIMDKVKISVLRANMAEAMACSGMAAKIRGVDSLENGSMEKADVAREIARRIGSVVAITGATDYISDGTDCFACENGHPLMGSVTGTGCSVTATTGCFLAVEKNAAAAAANALAYFALCGELAAQGAAGPGSFEIALRDKLYNATFEEIAANLKTRRL